MKGRLWNRLCVWAAMVLVSVMQLLASPTGSITGFVKDPSGAVIPGAHVTLTNLSTNVRQETNSDGYGAFQFLQLAPAEYSLVVEARGFKKHSIASVLVQVDQVTRVDLTMQLGSVAETVEVSGAAPLLEPDKTSMGSVVESRVIFSMPLNTRQFLDLALLTPGVVPAAVGVQGGGSSFNIAGARSQSTIFLLDGISNMDTQLNAPLSNFRIADAVQEFNVQTSVALPEFGRGTGAQVNIVTKSGSNTFHGSAYEYLRDTRLDAADFFTNKLRGPKNALNRNQFGATLGGPIRHDRTFFFLGYEGFLQVNPQVSTTRVPTAAERASVTDAISRRLLPFWPEPNATGTLNYIGNVPARDSNHSGLVRVDHALGERGRLTGRYTRFQGQSLAPGATPLTGRTDEPHSHSAVLTHTHTFSPTFLNELRLGFSRNLTDRKVEDLGFNAATIFTDDAGRPLPGVVDGSQNPVLSGLPYIVVAGGYAQLGGHLGSPQGRITTTYEIFENMTRAAPAGWTRHTFKWGFHLRREESRRIVSNFSRGGFNFSNFADFAAGRVNAAAIRTGELLTHWRRYPWDLYWQDTWKVRSNLTLNFGLRYEYPSALVEVSGRGSNFIPGVGPILFGSNKVLDIDPTRQGLASLIFRDAPFSLSKSGVEPDRNNFAPMFGFAYSPQFAEKLFGKDQTVIRGGIRVGYDETAAGIHGDMGYNPPGTVQTTQRAGLTQPAKFPWAIGFNQNVDLISNFGRQGPGTATVGVLGFTRSSDAQVRSAYLYQYSFGIQRRISSGVSLEADYLGSTGHKLGIVVDLNQPQVTVRDATRRGPLAPNEQLFPYNRFGQLPQATVAGNSNYNGLVLTGKYQGRRGILLQGSYTLGKSLDYNSAILGSVGEPDGVADSRNLRLQRGPSSFDIRQRAAFVYVLDLPAGPGHRLLGWQNPVSRQIFGGWQVSGITSLQSGAPFTVTSSATVDFSGFNNFRDRPNVTRSGPLPQDNHDPDNAFDTSFFRTAPTGRAGTSGRNQYYGPALANWDFAVLKNFSLGRRLGEQGRLQFRADFFNLFNHTNFSLPVRDMSSANFGKITQTVGSARATGLGTTAGPFGGPRLIQLSLRLQF